MLKNSGTKKIETERLILRKFKIDDVECFYNNIGNDNLIDKHVLWNKHKDKNETETLINKWIADYNNDFVYRWVVELKEINEVIGSISCHKIDPKNLTCEVGYSYCSKYWNKGYATEALKTVLDYLKEEKAFFDYWLFDKNCKIRVTSFFVFLEYILFNRKILGKYNSCLGKWLGVRHNGDIVQCNRYNKSYYGNINKIDKISDAFRSKGFNDILELAVQRRAKCAESCDVYDFCRGGCIVEASHEKGITELGGFSCVETREMYKYINTRINEIINNYSKYKDELNPTVVNCLEQYFAKVSIKV